MLGVRSSESLLSESWGFWVLENFYINFPVSNSISVSSLPEVATGVYCLTAAAGFYYTIGFGISLTKGVF